MRGNRGFIGKRKSFNLANDGASGVNNIFDCYNARKDNRWPKVKKLIDVTPSLTSQLEGQSNTFNDTDEGYENGNSVFY